MKKFFVFFLCVVCVVSASAKVKYVFYFIGDGMGVNHVNFTETYLAACEGNIGIKPLCFSSFPVAGIVNTYSANNGVTDSAAGGTALATGKKTMNGVLGMLKDQKTPVTSIAAWAKAAGAAVGVATTVSINHATPAAFYTHSPSRNEYYEIACQLLNSDYDFFAGAGLREANKKPEEGNVYDRVQANGYTIAQGYADYQQKASQAKKMMLLQGDPKQEGYNHDELPFSIDANESTLTIEDITRAGIDFLSKAKKDGFFFMVEGGKIDYAAHSNEAATMIQEMIHFDNAIKEAYAFYQQHPDETVIIVSADHETGGLVMGAGSYNIYTDIYQHQKVSISHFKNILKETYASTPRQFTRAYVEQQIQELMGIGKEIKLQDSYQQRLDNHLASLAKAIAAKSKVKEEINDLGNFLNRIMNEVAHISWATTSHSNGYVPVFAIGEGTEALQGRIDNIVIAPTIAKITGWK